MNPADPLPLLALGGLLMSFLITVLAGGPFIRLLRQMRIGKNIREEGPRSHYTKQGTPTMGGVLMILVVTVLWGAYYIVLPEVQRGDYIVQTLTPVLALVGVGLLGALDDYLNVLFGRGIRGRHKIIWQAIVAIAGSIYIQRHFAITGIFVPLVGEWEIGGTAFIVLSAIAIVGTSNGVNLTDGLDGLAGGTLVFAFLSFAFIAAARGFPLLLILCAIITGAVAGFLWFNVHPAEVFMGDAGALSMGATLAVVALTTGFVMLLPLAGIVFVAVTLSVIVQVAVFKIWRRRVFRMAPLHLHFELIGWPEQKVTTRFWLIGALAGIVAAILAFATPVR
jgi:phospho-N-acetylmuramoyl-pentapeptide-transferase